MYPNCPQMQNYTAGYYPLGVTLCHRYRIKIIVVEFTYCYTRNTSKTIRAHTQDLESREVRVESKLHLSTTMSWMDALGDGSMTDSEVENGTRDLNPIKPTSNATTILNVVTQKYDKYMVNDKRVKFEPIHSDVDFKPANNTQQNTNDICKQSFIEDKPSPETQPPVDNVPSPKTHPSVPKVDGYSSDSSLSTSDVPDYGRLSMKERITCAISMFTFLIRGHLKQVCDKVECDIQTSTDLIHDEKSKLLYDVTLRKAALESQLQTVTGLIECTMNEINEVQNMKTLAIVKQMKSHSLEKESRHKSCRNRFITAVPIMLCCIGIVLFKIV